MLKVAEMNDNRFLFELEMPYSTLSLNEETFEKDLKDFDCEIL